MFSGKWIRFNKNKHRKAIIISHKESFGKNQKFDIERLNS